MRFIIGLNYYLSSKKIKNKFIFYFHNDPLSMKGSKSTKERLTLLNSVEKIIFVMSGSEIDFSKILTKNLKKN